MKKERETPGWTQLKLPGQAPSSRCGHTVTSGGHYLLLFGGHGTGGWLSRYDVYYNDTIILDRVTAQWKRLPVSNDEPPPRCEVSVLRRLWSWWCCQAVVEGLAFLFGVEEVSLPLSSVV